jgi:hypothetical protein
MSEIETKKPLETFTLVKERCMLSNLNIRTEMHGDERQRAVDLQFDFSGANNLLSKLHPDLRHQFYKSQDTQDMLNPDHTPVLRFPLMGPISWDLEIPRTRLQLHGETPADDVVLGDGKTNKFKLTLMDGGTVKWHFRVQFSNPDDKAIAGLSRFLNDTVPVSLECRALEDEGDNFDKVDQLSQAPVSEARKKAEGMFVQPGDVVGNLFDQAGTDMAITTPEHDPDFREVKDEDTVSVEDVHAGGAAATVQYGGFNLPVEEPAAGTVTPIKGKRGSGKKAAAASLE